MTGLRRCCERPRAGCGIRRRSRIWLLFPLVVAYLLGLRVLRRQLAEIRQDREERERERKDQDPDASGGARPSDGTGLRIPASVYVRPDPLIYDQFFLMAHGLAVTWDNPDIVVEQGGVSVEPHALQPDTDYEVVARVWNGSVDAPVVNLPVRFSYLDFGIGTVSHPIGETTVDLPVKGAAGLPAKARQEWRTPPVAGHYCLQVELVWADDANPDNNLGQRNVDVKQVNSPMARFDFVLRNGSAREQTFRLEADAYAIPSLPACPSDAVGDRPKVSASERRDRQSAARGRHGREHHQVPDGWRLELSPAELALGPDEQRTVEVVALAPEGFRGRQPLNINAFSGDHLVGGVTLYALGEA